MIQNTDETNEPTTVLYNGYGDDFLADFEVNKAQSLRVSFNRQSLLQAVANELTAEVIRSLSGDQTTPDESFSVEDEANRVLDKYGINPASDSAFVTTAFASELFGDDIRVARSYFNTPNARREIQRISTRFNSEEWQTWLQQTANEAAQQICQDFAAHSLQYQYDSLEFVSNELRQLLARLSERQNACAERQSRLEEQQQNSHQENFQNVPNQPTEERGSFFSRVGKTANGLLDLNRYLPGRNNSAQNQPETSDPFESFLAQVEFEIAATQTESAFYNELLEVLANQTQVLEVSLTNTRKKYAELLSNNAKLESKRNFGLPGGEMLLNSSELTKATVKFLAPDKLQRDILLAELREKIDPVIKNCNGDVSDSDVTEMSRIIVEAITEKLSAFYVADAMIALLRYQPTFETQLHEAIRQTAVTDFFSSGWFQFLTPTLNHFAAVSYLQSEFEETNEQLNQIIGRITTSLNLNINTRYESFDSNREDFCFYIEYFCVPVESFEFYEQNISAFEKVKDSPIYNPHFDLYT